MAAWIVCFGELLLRMSAPGNQRLMQLPELNVHVGGAEANVAVSLARFGNTARMVSCLPDNPLGEAILQDLRGQGVDTTHIQTGDGRVGLYFLETGAVQRPSRIVYDRAHSAFVSRPADAYDWRSILQGADWLHISGITPATGPNAADAALQATRTATELGVRISFDGNYREQLWKAWSRNGPEILAELLSHASLAFINELDVGLIFGESHSDRADAEAAGRQKIADMEGHTLYAPDGEQLAVWQETMAPLTDEWKETASKTGIDADAAYDGLVETLKKYDSLVE